MAPHRTRDTKNLGWKNAQAVARAMTGRPMHSQTASRYIDRMMWKVRWHGLRRRFKGRILRTGDTVTQGDWYVKRDWSGWTTTNEMPWQAVAHLLATDEEQVRASAEKIRVTGKKRYAPEGED